MHGCSEFVVPACGEVHTVGRPETACTALSSVALGVRALGVDEQDAPCVCGLGGICAQSSVEAAPVGVDVGTARLEHMRSQNHEAGCAVRGDVGETRVEQRAQARSRRVVRGGLAGAEAERVGKAVVGAALDDARGVAAPALLHRAEGRRAARSDARAHVAVDATLVEGEAGSEELCERRSVRARGQRVRALEAAREAVADAQNPAFTIRSCCSSTSSCTEDAWCTHTCVS